MPKLPVDVMVADLSDDEARIVRAAFNSRNGLRASKPFHDRECKYGAPDAEFKGAANYVWRMLCFDFCSWAPHVCMPVCADFGIWSSLDDGGNWREVTERVRLRTKELDALIKRVESKLPVTAQKGVMRWARAFGVI
jgi:hypothetical protein